MKILLMGTPVTSARRVAIVKMISLLVENQINDIQSNLEETLSGFRKLAGKELKNNQTGEVVYTPPQSYDELFYLLANVSSLKVE